MRNDFSSADLSNADLSGANLTGADFTETNLDGTTLKNAKGLDQVKGWDKAVNREKAVLH